MTALLLSWLLGLLGLHARPASVAMSQDFAARHGVSIESYQRYDSWTGFTTDTRLEPQIKDDEDIARALKAMESDPDACARIAAHFVEQEGTQVRYGTLGASGEGTAEAGYADGEGTGGTIIISDLPYLRNPENFKKKVIHESFHRVQHKLGLIHQTSDLHAYAQRAKVLEYLNGRFSQYGSCSLPEVPEAARGQVSDTVSVGQTGSGAQWGEIAGRIERSAAPLGPDFGDPRAGTVSRAPAASLQPLYGPRGSMSARPGTTLSITMGRLKSLGSRYGVPVSFDKTGCTQKGPGPCIIVGSSPPVLKRFPPDATAEDVEAWIRRALP